MAIKDYLVVDIMKPVSTFVDLTHYFQGRVGDANAYCKLWIKSGSTSVDMTTRKMVFAGKDSNGTPFVDAGHFDDDQPGDDRQLGLITFYFPQGIFQKEGKWQEAYFKIQDQDGSDISTIDLTLNVLPNQVEMGIGIRPFIPILEETEAKINKALREMNSQQLLNQIDSMKTTVGAYTDLISQHAVLNKPETVDLINSTVNPFKTQINNDLDNLKSSVSSDINDAVSKSAWHTITSNGTMLNGCGGWVAGHLMYNDSVAFGRIFGYVETPAGESPTIDFATNPFGSTVDWANNTLQQIVPLWPANGNDGRPIVSINFEQNYSILGMWNIISAQANPINTEEAYHMVFSMPFTTFPSQIHVE